MFRSYSIIFTQFFASLFFASHPRSLGSCWNCPRVRQGMPGLGGNQWPGQRVGKLWWWTVLIDVGYDVGRCWLVRNQLLNNLGWWPLGFTGGPIVDVRGTGFRKKHVWTEDYHRVDRARTTWESTVPIQHASFLTFQPALLCVDVVGLQPSSQEVHRCDRLWTSMIVDSPILSYLSWCGVEV